MVGGVLAPLRRDAARDACTSCSASGMVDDLGRDRHAFDGRDGLVKSTTASGGEGYCDHRVSIPCARMD